jgi:hypothetical protein
MAEFIYPGRQNNEQKSKTWQNLIGPYIGGLASCSSDIEL